MRPLLVVALGLLAASAAAIPLQAPTRRGKGSCTNKRLQFIKQAKGYGILFYGDSIFESLLGTNRCDSCIKKQHRTTCAGVPDVLQAKFGPYKPGVMAVSRDQTANLLYGLQHGELPTKNFPKLAVLLIGTNDLKNCGWGIDQAAAKDRILAKQEPGIVARIKEAVGLMQKQMPNTPVLLMGILPRGTGTGKGQLNADNDFSWPSHYTKSIARINAKLKAFAQKSAGKVVFLDCGSLFIKRGVIDVNLMADAIHPSAAGWEKLAACMLPAIKSLY